jgi:hypothetical protein
MEKPEPVSLNKPTYSRAEVLSIIERQRKIAEYELVEKISTLLFK